MVRGSNVFMFVSGSRPVGLITDTISVFSVRIYTVVWYFFARARKSQWLWPPSSEFGGAIAVNAREEIAVARALILFVARWMLLAEPGTSAVEAESVSTWSHRAVVRQSRVAVNSSLVTVQADSPVWLRIRWLEGVFGFSLRNVWRASARYPHRWKVPSSKVWDLLILLHIVTLAVALCSFISSMDCTRNQVLSFLFAP